MSAMSERLSAAVALAAEEHAGQVDKLGAPYILHPLHVLGVVAGDPVDNPYEREALLCAAVLHDVLEDTESDRRALDQRIYDEFGSRCHSALDHLTRWPDEDYE